MPKEVIGLKSLDGRTDPTPIAVEVSWGRETWVQIGTVNQKNDQLGIERGWFVGLSRHEINKLIRVLRKARDQVFGVDE